MALPIQSAPTYTLEIPSTKTSVKFRPFLVKDEKALLIAQQSEDNGVMLDTVKSVIQSCIITDINVDSLASFDIEYIFTQLRSVSVGEFVELTFQCDDCTDEKARALVSIDLRKLKVTFPADHVNKIPLFDDVGIVLKYPTINTMKKLEDETNDIDAIFDIVIDCIDYIYSTEEVFTAKEQSKDELIKFLNNLTSEQFDKIQQFFKTIPTLRQDITYTCPVCGKVHNKYLEGLSSFF